MSTNNLILFRYRNLLTSTTLDEHRKIINKYGYCWWGWWQRPAEDRQDQIWKDLQDKLKTVGQIRIGLFDSEPEREAVHFATLTAVLPPDGDRAPVLSEEDLEKVPPYYRDAPFSSAWMRLTTIDPEPTQFFGCYSFARAPPLNGITPLDRAHYTNKVIIDAAELRSMDTTIWECRKKSKTDRSDRILTASSNVTNALSPRPILLRSSTILHISDLHLASGKAHIWDLIGSGNQTLHARITQALRDTINVGLIVISGDLTCVASDKEFYEAFRFVHALLGALKLGPEQLIVVPGNHDLMWTKNAARVDGDKVSEAPADAQRSYRLAFYERVFRHPAATHLGMARRYVCPNGLTLEIGGLNSSGLEQGKNWLAGMGRVADGALDEIAHALGWKAKEPSTALRLLVHHHHLTATEDILPLSGFERGFGMASDAKKTLQAASPLFFRVEAR
jgi:hypothetical protein